MSQTSTQTAAIEASPLQLALSSELSGIEPIQESCDLSCDEQLSVDYFNDNELSLLYPQLPDDYFVTHPDAQLTPEKNIIEKAIDAYQNLPVKPYIRRKNLNGNDPDAPEKGAWEIGIKIDF